MKIISNLATTATCTDDGKPCPAFPRTGNLHGKKLSKSFSAKGLFVYSSKLPGVGVLIPESEIDALAMKHEPRLAPTTIPDAK